MDASEVEMENADKFPVDLAKGKNDLDNSKQEGEHKQQDEMYVEDQNSCKEVVEKEQTKIENRADHQSHSRGNGPSEILEEEKNPEKNAMEEEKGSGEDSMEEEKNSGENLQQFTELPPDGVAGTNKSEKGGSMVYEPNEKSTVTTVTTDGDAAPNEMSENEDEADRNAMAENKDAARSFNNIPETKNDASGLNEMPQSDDNCVAADQVEPVTPYAVVKYNSEKPKGDSEDINGTKMTEEEETGTPEDQAKFMKELESFYREQSTDFKAPKFYGQILNCLKLYRAVTRLGGYDRVTGLKLWRQVGESFHPPKTCTTVSWTFRIFYEKALLEYERHKLQNGELQLALTVVPEPVTVENETPGSGRARRDAAARAMQGWHAPRHNGYGEVGEPIIKDKNLNNMPKREKNLKSIGSLKHKRQNEVEHPVKAARTETSKQLVTTVVDVGPPADWVKINVRESKDCFEVYALVPGLLREEVRVQSDPAGRLVITGQPEQLENPWGITAFKKVVSLPARIDPLQTSAVVSLHGRLFVRVPFEQSNI